MIGSNRRNINDSSLLEVRFLDCSPIMEEGILIAIAIVVILGVIGIIFAVFSWLENSSTLWNQF